MPRRNTAKTENNKSGEPVNIGDRAMDNIRFIRETMERTTSFTAVPGYGGILMGATAIAAAYMAARQPLISDWLLIWIAEAVLAFSIGLLSMWQKSKIAGQSLFSAPARKFAFGFIPPLLCGVVITLGLWRFAYFAAMVPAWMLLYGAAVVAGGANSVRVVPVMGWLFIVFGSAAFVLPSGWGNPLMGISFGLLHIVFGAIIAWRHGG